MSIGQDARTGREKPEFDAKPASRPVRRGRLGPTLRGLLPAPVVSALTGAVPASLLRASTIKLKINGRCVNRCAFCLFHDDPSRLEVADLERFFEVTGRHRFGTVIVNGGEPTIHPHFLDICAFLRGRFRGKARLVLGTNLLPLRKLCERRPEFLGNITGTFDHLEIGCDDEHRNIETLETWAPRLISAGVTLTVNVVKAYCTAATWKGIRAVGEWEGVDVTLSELHHFTTGTALRDRIERPCRRRTWDLQLNCNGDGFFCFRQDFGKPSFNIRRDPPEEIVRQFTRDEPGVFPFCFLCYDYRPETLLQGAADRFLTACRPASSNAPSAPAEA